MVLIVWVHHHARSADGYLWHLLLEIILQVKSPNKKVTTDAPEFEEAHKASRDKLEKLLSINGSKTTDDFHRELGKIMWEYVGMARNEEGLKKQFQRSKTQRTILERRKSHWREHLLPELRKLTELELSELGELMARDALEESCGGHFREESQTEENEALRDDENFAHVAAWEWQGDDTDPLRHIEELTFENVPLTQRSYK